MRWAKFALLTCFVAWSAGCGGEGGEVNSGQDYATNWGPAIGAALPTLDVKDIEGAVRTFDDLTGEKGLVIFFVRSSNW
ncbi:MAG: hypothetical protein F4W90_10820 [Gammaproteobacteria bacterium]|nr:hypothetical protein [Gammaproteobacteria bacterium]